MGGFPSAGGADGAGAGFPSAGGAGVTAADDTVGASFSDSRITPCSTLLSDGAVGLTSAITSTLVFYSLP